MSGDPQSQVEFSSRRNLAATNDDRINSMLFGTDRFQRDARKTPTSVPCVNKSGGSETKRLWDGFLAYPL